ncbi:hypothetical protein ACJZTR_02955 [Neorickettsia risticii]|uniref:Histidine phosphotransferase ChpT C-terminal domain-containing protein n=1 Tax=Neorickettsia risticii (strain Illinois) TaxID=434131 RepID=C6V5J2_NEORI|nr:hypothetical protein [Neorickettsia risticii]ACT69667.1 conserved hypothetical protein [Neorickettsia risticii str. Illinois]
MSIFNKDCKTQSILNLLISSVFHDLGNCVSLLSLLVEVNRDDPKAFDFNELLEVNSRMLINLRVLQYMFLEGSKGARALADIEQYLLYKGKKAVFHFGIESIQDEFFVLMLHSLLLLSRLLTDYAKIDVFAADMELKFAVVSDTPIDEKRLKLFDCIVSGSEDEIELPEHHRSHLYYIKRLLMDLGLHINTTFEPKEFMLRIFPRD